MSIVPWIELFVSVIIKDLDVVGKSIDERQRKYTAVSSVRVVGTRNFSRMIIVTVYGVQHSTCHEKVRNGFPEKNKNKQN